jgi:cellulose synthase/poly-beta-1,6-N-acetylglucosamine synthase-like glycosyltransferase
VRSTIPFAAARCGTTTRSHGRPSRLRSRSSLRPTTRSSRSSPRSAHCSGASTQSSTCSSVNDGSTDGTLDRLREAFDLVVVERIPRARLATERIHATYASRSEPRLTVLDKDNGGKADALNAGIAHALYPLVCAIDADTMLDPSALARLAWEFQARPDTVAAGGIVRVINGSSVDGGKIVKVETPPDLLVNIQILEYLRAFLLGRIAWSRLGMLLIISGAFGLFRREAIVEVGGYDTKTVGEDAELVLRLHRYRREHGLPCRITFFPDPICWTEAPSSLRVLIRQRDRWQRGLTQMLATHARWSDAPGTVALASLRCRTS